MARMKFVCDSERCIECNSCVTACKNENEVPWGVNRRRVVTLTRELAASQFRLRYLDSRLSYLWAVMRPLAYFGVVYDGIEHLSPASHPELRHDVDAMVAWCRSGVAGTTTWNRLGAWAIRFMISPTRASPASV